MEFRNSLLINGLECSWDSSVAATLPGIAPFISILRLRRNSARKMHYPSKSSSTTSLRQQGFHSIHDDERGGVGGGGGDSEMTKRTQSSIQLTDVKASTSFLPSTPPVPIERTDGHCCGVISTAPVGEVVANETMDTKAARYICSCVVEPKIILYPIDKAPRFVVHNLYIWTGYRAYLPYKWCAKSIFIWSNETLNIWTHIAGLLLFMGLTLYDNLVLLPEFKDVVSMMEFIIGNVSLLCFQICMVMSICFHVFCCHSEKLNQHWLALDLTGISAAILGCYLPGIYYAFFCFPLWRDIYLLIVVIILLITLLLPFVHKNYLSSKFARMRTTLYVVTLLYGLIPAIHWIILMGGFSSSWVQIYFPKLVFTYLIGAGALAFYLSEFPERAFPGRVDFFGHSHQFWHVLIVGALYYWHEAGISFMKKRLTEECVVNGTLG